MERHPDWSLPKAVGTDAAAEAAYRLLGNPAVRHPEVVEHLGDVAWRNAKGAAQVLAIHDTSQFSFDGTKTRSGLGEFSKTRQGFFGHFALLAAAEGVVRPYGVAGFDAYTVREGRWYRDVADGEEQDLGLGSERWSSLALAVEHQKPDDIDLIHVMDREGDFFELMAELSGVGASFVIRAAHNRAIVEDSKRIQAMLASQPVVVQRELPVPARQAVKSGPPRSRRQNGGQVARIAMLEVRFAQVTLKVPKDSQVTSREPLAVWVVDVVETSPPDGVDGVHWRILTNVPVSGADAALAVVDIYRRRWLIEEFFKALKTGCAFEKRQLESRTTLLNLLVMLLPIATGLLNLRAVARQAENAPASQVINDVQLAILKQNYSKILGARPTARTVMLAVASLGGHLKRNGAPGWQSLGHGWQVLRAMEIGWQAAMAAMMGGNSRGSKM